jgi:ATP-dependent helicase/nuclease subunit A
VEYKNVATTIIANTDAIELAMSQAQALDSRIGQAMHRLLERYVPPQHGSQLAHLATDAQQSRIAQEFTLEPAHMTLAHSMALAIVQGEGAWAWDASQLGWQGNEVGLVHRGRPLRIDRLVLRRGVGGAEGQWWVLDYKFTRQPQLQPELCEQLLNYRAAVAQAQPGQVVRAAFLTPLGSLIELHPHEF